MGYQYIIDEWNELKLNVYVNSILQVDTVWNYPDVRDSFNRLYIPIDGAARLQDDHRAYDMEAGRMYLIPAEARCSYLCEDSFSMYCLHFNVELFPGKDLLIVDVGTAITFDFMRGDGEFLGGNISPGIGMRLRALHEFTEHLPLVDCSMEYGEVGRNTQDALLNGVMRGILLEVQGYIDAWRREKKDAFVVITGGGSLFLKESLKREVCFEEKLVFIGLNRLLEYQKKS